MAIMRMPKRPITIALGGIDPGTLLLAAEGEASGGSTLTHPVGDAGGVKLASEAPVASDRIAAVSPLWPVLAVVVVVGSWLGITKLVTAAPALKVADGATAFAMFYVAAQVIERVIEPFSHLVLKTGGKKKDLHDAVARALATGDESHKKDAANKQEDLDQRRGERALFWAAVATVLGMGLSAVLGLYFIGSVVAAGSAPAQELDILVTGIVLGGGSKPLHDLITRVEKKKEEAEDPPETNPPS